MFAPLPLAVACVFAVLAAAPAENPQSWLDFLTRGGLLGGSLLIVWGLFTDRLISGTRHRRELAVRDEELHLWREAASRATGSLERVAGVFFPPTPPPGAP